MKRTTRVYAAAALPELGHASRKEPAQLRRRIDARASAGGRPAVPITLVAVAPRAVAGHGRGQRAGRLWQAAEPGDGRRAADGGPGAGALGVNYGG